MIRAAEVISSLCLATDLGMAFPFEHGLHGTIVAMRLGERLGLEQQTARETYYASLLFYSGCKADSEFAVEIFGGDMTEHLVPVLFGSSRETIGGIIRSLPNPDNSRASKAVQIARRLPKAARMNKPHQTALCEVAAVLAERVGLPDSVQRLFAFLTEHWDGSGQLGRAKGDEIPLALRVAHVARDAAFQNMIAGTERATEIVRRRAGHAFDPEIASCLADNATDILALDPVSSVWDESLALEPAPQLTLDGAGVDRALGAMGDFADLVAPCLAGHSGGVSELAAAAAARCGLATADLTTVRRAALVHDVGRVSVSSAVWLKPGPLTADEWERVRLHPYHSERVLSRSAFLTGLAAIAGAHHERLDGTGYHRASKAAALPLPARLMAAADAYHAMTEPRPHRAALTPAAAAETLGREARAGLFDADVASAVIEAAGQRAPRVERPAGLTEREAQVVGLLARGLQTKQIARVLGISVKTADHHVQHAYGKIGVSTRAAATLYASEHGLVAWGELPIARSRPTS